jgi:hypothetical protein
MFDKLKKEEGGEMVEEKIEENSNVAESLDTTVESTSQIGI